MNRLLRKILILFIAVFVLFAHVPSACRNTVMAEEDESAVVEETVEESEDTGETVNEEEVIVVQEEHKEETVTEAPAETVQEETVNDENEETVSETGETDEIIEVTDEEGEETEILDEEMNEEEEVSAEEEAEIEYGPHEFVEEDVNGLYIRVTDSDGAFPVETIIKTEPVAAEDVFAAVSDVVETSISEITAVDISFWYEDEEIEPILPVDVEIRVNGADEDVEQQIVHIDDDNNAELVKAVMNSNGDMTIAEFTVGEFSTYAFVKSTENEEAETRNDTDPEVISDVDGFNRVIAELNAAGGSKTIKLAADITYSGNVTLNNGTLTILGEGHVLTGTTLLKKTAVMNLGEEGYSKTLQFKNNDNTNCIFDVGDSAVLNIYNGTTIGPHSSSGTSGGIQAHSQSTVNMYGGTITDCHSTVSVSGGLYFDGNSVFNMHGGTITGCTGMQGGAIGLSGAAPIGGSGESSVTMNMYGGTISNCVDKFVGGGAICAWTAYPVTININGGTITNCSSVSYGYGGAICIYTTSDTTFNMGGGTITGNKCGGAGYGGAVFIYASSNNTSINFNAGTIKNNTAKFGAGIMSFGGNITIANGFGLYNNTASDGGDDIYNAGGKVKLGTVDTSATLENCGHKIDGWYYDDDPRWNYNSCTGEEDYLELFDHVGETYSEEYGLKAAHGEIVYTYTYTVTWVNYDGTVLETDEAVEEGTIPTYDGETPTRPDSSEYTYTFNGWSPEITEASENITYTATFTETKIPEPSGGGTGGGDTPGTTPSQSQSGGTVIPTPQPTPEPEPEPVPDPTPEPDPGPTPDPNPPIDPDPTPGALNRSWALVNLILTALTTLLAFGMIATRRKKEEVEDEEEVKRNNFKLLGLVPAIVSIVVFLITEDMKRPMVMTDKFTIVMAAIAVVGVLLAYFTRNRSRNRTQDPEPQMS